MLFITDEDVPDSISDFLAQRGHDVRRARDFFLPRTLDSTIAAAASDLGAVVVTFNRRHFVSLATRRRKNGQPSYPNMSLIAFRCPHSDGLRRIQELIELIEATYTIRVERSRQRLIAEITATVLRILDDQVTRPRRAATRRGPP